MCSNLSLIKTERKGIELHTLKESIPQKVKRALKFGISRKAAYKRSVREKIKEALKSVLPITAIVLLLCFTITPVSTDVLLSFSVGAILVIVGMGFFTLGADMSMTVIGQRIGTAMTKSKNLPIIIGVSFLIGFIITLAEPDLQVLAQQIPQIPVLTIFVAVGVGLFLVISLLRILFKIPLNYLLIGFYVLVFGLSFFVQKDFWAIAFDSGGVTTGPMTVPFIMALGVGVASIRSDKGADNDSFGLVALCSVGPILSILIMGLVYNPDSAVIESVIATSFENSQDFIGSVLSAFPEYFKEVALSLLPIIAFFVVAQIAALRLSKRQVAKIFVGFAYTYLGLVLFLTGANTGFMAAGSMIGQLIASIGYNWILIPIAMVIGYFIVMAEPAVYILNKQVNEITDGAVPPKMLLFSLSIGVSVSVGLAMLRILTGWSIMWFMLIGYSIAIILSFFVPKIFTSIAFDSGGVASGPMTAAFLLPLAKGACEAVGGNMMTDAFGVVAMVAMTPLITIQILGLYFKLKQRHAQNIETIDSYAEDEIIEL